MVVGHPCGRAFQAGRGRLEAILRCCGVYSGGVDGIPGGRGMPTRSSETAVCCPGWVPSLTWAGFKRSSAGGECA